jgi:hypothetical protein
MLLLADKKIKTKTAGTVVKRQYGNEKNKKKL